MSMVADRLHEEEHKDATFVPALEGADPEFPVPEEVFVEEAGDAVFAHGNRVHEEEFAWMLAKRPLARASLEGLARDYGRQEAADMAEAFRRAGLERLLPALHWPGVGTRWRRFLSWCRAQQGRPDAPEPQEGCLSGPEAAFRAFGQSLGRVWSYRAIALSDSALGVILEEDNVFPSGQLRVDAAELEEIVERQGVRTVCVARLFISQLRRLIGHDPSVSLHDDWQTTCIIASEYAEGTGRPVYLFEVSCPVVESIGWTLQQVAVEGGPAVLGDQLPAHLEPWFLFKAPGAPEGVWLDGRMQRTERFCLYGVPFLRNRMRHLYAFPPSEMSVAKAVTPFVRRQADMHHQAAAAGWGEKEKS